MQSFNDRGIIKGNYSDTSKHILPHLEHCAIGEIDPGQRICPDVDNKLKAVMGLLSLSHTANSLSVNHSSVRFWPCYINWANSIITPCVSNLSCN